MENNYKIIQELRAKIEQLNKIKNQNGAALVTFETMPIVNSNQIKENNKTGGKKIFINFLSFLVGII